MRDADASVGLAIRKYRRGLPLLTACGLALGLRLYALGRYPLDGDEIFSIRASAATWGNVISIAINDKSHPPLFYAILKLWLLLVPAKEIWARLPSVLFGTALIPVTFGICRKLRLAEADTVLVILVIAVNSELIFYAQQARMFPLFELSSALSILAFIYFLESWVSWRLLALLSLVNLLMVYSHYWGWLAIGAQLLCVLLGHRAKVGGFLWSSAIVAVGFAPWALGVTTAGVDHGAVMRQIAWMGADIAGSRDYAELVGEIDGPIDFKHATSLGIVLFLGPPTVIFLRQVRRGAPPPFDTRGIGLWGLLAGIPVVLTSFGSYLAHQSFWGTRHLTMIIVPYFVMVGLSLTELSAPFAKQVLRCLILAWAVTASTLSLAEIKKKYIGKLSRRRSLLRIGFRSMRPNLLLRVPSNTISSIRRRQR